MYLKRLNKRNNSPNQIIVWLFRNNATLLQHFLKQSFLNNPNRLLNKIIMSLVQKHHITMRFLWIFFGKQWIAYRYSIWVSDSQRAHIRNTCPELCLSTIVRFAITPSPLCFSQPNHARAHLLKWARARLVNRARVKFRALTLVSQTRLEVTKAPRHGKIRIVWTAH